MNERMKKWEDELFSKIFLSETDCCRNASTDPTEQQHCACQKHWKDVRRTKHVHNQSKENNSSSSVMKSREFRRYAL